MALPSFAERTRTVRLTHHDPATGGEPGAVEATELTLRRVSNVMYGVIRTALAPPTLYRNGEPSATVDPKQAPLFEERMNAAVLGVALRDHLDAKAPTTSGAAEWITFADAVRREIDDAGLTRADLAQLFAEIKLLDAGIGKTLGKGSSEPGGVT